MKITENKIKLTDTVISEVYGGSPDTGTDFFYDIAYILAYSYASLISYIGAHSQSYGLAFK